MTVIARRPLVSVADYLAGEESAECRREYLDGELHPISGASARHNLICGNLAAALHRHLAGGLCRVFMADLKVHLRSAGEEYFYYPDVMVACRPDDNASHYRDHPCVLVEVISPTTERTDRREKLFAYQQITALQEYVLIAQDSIDVAVHGRAADWAATRPDAEGIVELKSLGFAMPVAELYAGIDMAA
jgi:Uma2 family endonuclease